METAHQSIDSIYHIHKAVEQSRESTIPDWAYRDVLFMLIYYSVASFEALERKLTTGEKEEVYDVFKRVGERMKLRDLAPDYTNWLTQRAVHLENDLVKSKYTEDLFKQYKKHLGAVRYFFLLEGQKLIVPKRVKQLLGFRDFSLLNLVIPFYKFSRIFKVDILIKKVLLPSAYEKEIKDLDVVV